MSKHEELTIKEHLFLAERHIKKAQDLAYDEKKGQPFYVRTRIAKAHSLVKGVIQGGQVK